MANVGRTKRNLQRNLDIAQRKEYVPQVMVVFFSCILHLALMLSLQVNRTIELAYDGQTDGTQVIPTDIYHLNDMFASWQELVVDHAFLTLTLSYFPRRFYHHCLSVLLLFLWYSTVVNSVKIVQCGMA